MQSDPERRARGAQKLGEILGQTPEQADRPLGDVSPHLATYVIETIYGKSTKARRSTRARGRSSPSQRWRRSEPRRQLRTHIGGALRCGVAREDLGEIMMQLVPYVGVAAAINGVAVCREVFAAADKN
jgi:4-carboxymuconolactone decarboxylase